MSLLTDFGWAAAHVHPQHAQMRTYTQTHPVTHSHTQLEHAEQQEHKDSADEGQTAVKWLRLSLIMLC